MKKIALNSYFFLLSASLLNFRLLSPEVMRHSGSGSSAHNIQYVNPSRVPALGCHIVCYAPCCLSLCAVKIKSTASRSGKAPALLWQLKNLTLFVLISLYQDSS